MHSRHSRYRLTLIAATLAACFGSVPAAAETDAGTVVISAPPVRADLDPNSLVNPYRVESSGRFGTELMTREDIEALAPKDVIDLLDKAVGMNLGYQGRRSPYFFEERGGGNLTFIIDGAVLPTSANRILQQIPLAAIEQIEIVRGSTSLALGPTIPIGSSNSGSGINTGFVVIRTRQPKTTEAELSTFYEKAVGQPTASGESLYAGTRLGDSAASGYLGVVASGSDRPSKPTWFDGQESKAGIATGGLSAGRFSAGLLAYKDNGRFEMQRGVTFAGVLDSSKWYYDPLETTVLSSNMSMAWSDSQVTLMSLFATKYQQMEHNESFANATASLRYFVEKTRGYSLRHNARFGDTLVQIGTQATTSEGFGPNTNTPYNNWKTSVDGWSAAVEQKLLGERLLLDAGYRRDVKHIDYSAVSATALSANSNVDMAPARTYTLGARWKIADGYFLNGRYFDGREGTAGDFDIRTQGNTPLHAATQKREEIALEADVASYLKPTVTWFDVNIHNQKTATTNTYVVAGDTYYYYAEGDAHRQGVELQLKGEIAAHTSYSVSWTHLTTNDTTSAGVSSDALGLSSPKDLYTARFSHLWREYRFNASYKRVSSWTQSTSPLGVVTADLGGYDRIDANVMRDLLVGGHRMTVELYGRNLGNDHYATRYTTGYYYDRGRTVGLQLTARL